MICSRLAKFASTNAFVRNSKSVSFGPTHVRDGSVIVTQTNYFQEHKTYC